MQESNASRQLRDALAADLNARPNIDWKFSVRYSELDGTELGWGFDVERADTRPLALWFDQATQTCQFEVPATFIRRRGVVMTWADVSEAKPVIAEVLRALDDWLAHR